MLMNRFASVDRLVVLCGTAAVLCAAGPLWALSFTVEPATATAGGGVSICVRMDGSGGNTVAGVQMDLVWDVNCLSANISSGNAASCSAESATGKSVMNRVQDSGNAMTAILVSLSDTKPIPDGRLFCCGFTVAGFPPDNVCSIDMGNVVASDSAGKSITGLGARGGVVQIAGVPSGGARAPAGVPLPGGPGVSAPVTGPQAAPQAGGLPGGLGGQAPVGAGKALAPAGVAPAGQPGVAGEEAVQNVPEAGPAATAAATFGAPQHTPAAVRTPVATRGTPQPTAPRPQFTPTAPAPTAAAVGSPTGGATTPTAKAKGRKHKAKKRRSHAD